MKVTQGLAVILSISVVGVLSAPIRSNVARDVPIQADDASSITLDPGKGSVTGTVVDGRAIPIQADDASSSVLDPASLEASNVKIRSVLQPDDASSITLDPGKGRVTETIVDGRAIPIQADDASSSVLDPSFLETSVETRTVLQPDDASSITLDPGLPGRASEADFERRAVPIQADDASSSVIDPAFPDNSGVKIRTILQADDASSSVLDPAETQS